MTAELVETPAPAWPMWQLAVASFFPAEGREKAQRWIKFIPLLGVLIIQIGLTLRLQNSAFRDEGLYIWTGHREIAHMLHGAVLYDKPESYFSGAPTIYPVIAAMLDRVGGLMLVRAFSLLLMIVATCSIYSFTKRLFSEKVALVGAAAFAIAGPTMHLGNFATFDAMALCLIALSMALGVRAVQNRTIWWLPLVSFLLVLAVATKYAAAMFVPFVLGTMVLASLAGAKRGIGLLYALITSLIVAEALIALGGSIFKGEVDGIRFTTTNRQVIDNTSTKVILQQVWHFVGPWWVLAALGMVMAIVKTRRFLLPILLLIAMLAPALYQIHIHEGVSLDKHLDFGLVFAAPLIGLVTTVHFTRRSLRAVFVTGLAAWLLISGLSTSKFLFGEWANSDPLVDSMRYAFESDPYIHTLGDVYEPPRYAFENSTQYWQWDTTDSIYYEPKDGPPLRGLDAAKAGLNDHYWQYVYLDGTQSQQIMPLMAGYGYKLTDTITLHDNRGADVYYVWQNFTSP